MLSNSLAGSEGPGENPGVEAALPYILVIDDYPDHQVMLQDLLEWKGYQVRVAANGEAGLAEIERSVPAMVLMDMTMPGLDGYEATRRLRGMPGCERVPVVALTGRARLEDRARCLEAGCNEYLAKPFDLDQLLMIVQRYLEHPGSSAESSCGSPA